MPATSKHPDYTLHATVRHQAGSILAREPYLSGLEGADFYPGSGMLSSQPFIFETRIRFIDTDASGRIHYTCMFRYFESAEIEFMRSLGITYTESDIAFPRVHAECDFRLALVHDDVIQIEVRLTKLGRSSVKLEFRTLKDNALAAWGNVVIVCMDRKTQQSAEIPDRIKAQLLPVLSLEAR